MGECSCLLCQPVKGVRPHPIYGYDLDKVSEQECLTCNELIGDEKYIEYLIFARFGGMYFLHDRCASPAFKKEHARTEKRAKARRSLHNV